MSRAFDALRSLGLEDFITHVGDFKAAVEIALAVHIHDENDADYTYWQHQLKVLNKLQEKLNAKS